MDDIARILISTLMSYLDTVGFDVKSIEREPLPDHVIALLQDPESAKSVYYFKVVTSVGTFGAVPHESGIDIDLAGTGLDWTNLVPDTAGMDTSQFRMVNFPSLEHLNALRIMLEAIANATKN